MNLTEFSKEVHENSVAHGWWDPEPDFATIIALCHSELSEALEEYRDGRHNIYCEEIPTCPHPGECVECFGDGFLRNPEGIAIELADCIIRILDYCGRYEVNVQGFLDDMEYWTKEPKESTLPELLSRCHLSISFEFSKENYLLSEDHGSHLAACIRSIYVWCIVRGINIEEIMRLKHEYNKSRPYRHGGKLI